MLDEPKMSTWVLAALATAFFAVIAYYTPEQYQWVRMLALLVAIIFGTVFLVTALDWFTKHTADRLQELQYARVYGTVALANSLKGLNTEGIDIVARHDRTKILGMVGGENILWAVKCPGMDVPYDFISEFIEWSQQSDPYLYPISQAHKIGVYSAEDEPWHNAERLAAAFTDQLVKLDGFAEPAVGPQPARLKVPLERVAKKYGVEL